MKPLDPLGFYCILRTDEERGEQINGPKPKSKRSVFASLEHHRSSVPREYRTSGNDPTYTAEETQEPAFKVLALD